jgi:hypothetical protein
MNKFLSAFTLASGLLVTSASAQESMRSYGDAPLKVNVECVESVVQNFLDVNPSDIYSKAGYINGENASVKVELGLIGELPENPDGFVSWFTIEHELIDPFILQQKLGEAFSENVLVQEVSVAEQLPPELRSDMDSLEISLMQCGVSAIALS